MSDLLSGLFRCVRQYVNSCSISEFILVRLTATLIFFLISFFDFIYGINRSDGGFNKGKKMYLARFVSFFVGLNIKQMQIYDRGPLFCRGLEIHPFLSRNTHTFSVPPPPTPISRSKSDCTILWVW